MKITPILLLPLCLLAGQAVAVDLPQKTSPALQASQSSISRMIVKLKPRTRAASGLTKTDMATMIVSTRAGLQASFQRNTALGSYVMKLATPISLAEAEAYARRIQADPNVEYAEPDRLLFPMVATIPDDPRFPDQWHYANPDDGNAGAANLPLAWGVTQGSNDVVVSVVDTGAINHADLKNRFIGGNVASSGRDFMSTASMARDGNGRDNNPTDEGDWDSYSDSSWHGTHVAGTIAAQSNNNYGVTGIDWNARLLTVRTLGKGGGWSSDIADGIMWSAGKTIDGVANPNPAHVINMSLGGSGKCSNTFQNAINYAVSQGTTVVVAAGNENQDASKSEPANCKNVIAVAALTQNGARASFSNYGSVVDIAAPGVSVLSTLDNGSKTANNSNTYAYYAGTSMATPHVTGVVSLMLGANSHLRDGSIPRANVPALLEKKLKAAARSFPTGTGRDCNTAKCGAGALDAYRAVLAVSKAPVVNAGADQITIAGAVVTLNGSASDDQFGGKITAYQWQQVSGTAVTLNGATTASPTFTALAAGELQFRLTVTDDTGLTASDDITVNVSSGSGDPILSVNKDGSGTGTVSSSPAGIDCGADCFEEYTSGTDVTLTAVPDTDSEFTGWSGACSGTASTCSVTMDETHSVTATFTSTVVNTAILTVQKAGSGNGNVSSNPAGINCGSDCTEDYATDADITLTATPDGNSTFAGWSGACNGTASTCTVSMTAAKTVTARFAAKKQFTLKVRVLGKGEGNVSSDPTGIDCGASAKDCAERYAAGTSVTLTAAPAANSVFKGWKGTCRGKATTCTVKVNNARTVSAEFAPAAAQHRLRVSLTGWGDGSITSNPAGINCSFFREKCSANFAKGTEITLTATPDTDSRFVKWAGACKGTTPTCTLSMTSAKSAKAVFRYNF